jgi:hypothetical protein
MRLAKEETLMACELFYANTEVRRARSSARCALVHRWLRVGGQADYDPAEWTLQGSLDGREWFTLHSSPMTVPLVIESSACAACALALGLRAPT